MRMARRFVQIQHWRHAGVAAFQQRTPGVARFLRKHLRQFGAQRRPVSAIPLRLKRRVVDAQRLEQRGVKLRLNRPHRQPFAVGATIRAVKMRAAVQQIGLALAAPFAHGVQGVDHAHQQGRAVGHRRVHHLATAGLAGVQPRGQHTQRQEHGAAAAVSHQVQRRHRLASAANAVQRARQRQIIDVVPHGGGQCAVLTPAGHPPVHQRRLARQAHLGPQAQALHHTGAKALNQHIGASDHRQRGVDVGRGFQIQRQGVARAIENIALWVKQLGHRPPGGGFALDAHHLGAQISQQHGRHRRRAQRGKLDHAHAVQRAGAGRGSKSRLRHDAPPEAEISAAHHTQRSARLARRAQTEQAARQGRATTPGACCEQR